MIFPNIVGFPGFILIPLKISSKPKFKKASFVKSASPTDTPPEVIIKSASSEFFIKLSKDSTLSLAWPIKVTSQFNSLHLVRRVGVLEL